MELEVYWLEIAENKIKDIYNYYTIKTSKRVAKELTNGIVETTIGVGKQPKIGQIEISLKHRKQEFRYLVYKNYKIVYWVNFEFKRVEIVNVFDTRQNPNKLEKDI